MERASIITHFMLHTEAKEAGKTQRLFVRTKNWVLPVGQLLILYIYED